MPIYKTKTNIKKKENKEEQEKEEKEEKEEQYKKVSKKLKVHSSKLKIFFIIVILLAVYTGCVVAIHYATGGKIKFNF